MALEDQTEADIGFGTTLWMHDGLTPGAYVEVMVELRDINPPAISAGVVEATHHKSPGRFRQRISGLRDTAEVQVVGHVVRNDTAIKALRDKVGARGYSGFQIRIPPTTEGGADGETHEFNALATGFEQTSPLEDVMLWTLTLTPSGPVTVTQTPVAGGGG